MSLAVIPHQFEINLMFLIGGGQMGCPTSRLNWWGAQTRVDIGYIILNPRSTELFNVNFLSLEVVSRYRDPQLQVTENLCNL